METGRLVEFGRIDQAADPAFFVRFLDSVCAAASVQAYKRRLNELLELGAGQRVLDVGCGTGDDVRAMAAQVGAGGLVVGVDNSQAMIDVARQRAAGKGLQVEFQIGDVQQLPYADGSFASCRADRSLMHVPDPRQALAEMVRVTHIGGPVVIYEVDFETLLIDADDRLLARKIGNAWCDSFRDGWLGRRIPALAASVGLKEVQVIPHTMLLSPDLALLLLGKTTVERAVAMASITLAEGTRWLVHLDELQQSGRFFSSLTGFIVAARR